MSNTSVNFKYVVHLIKLHISYQVFFYIVANLLENKLIYKLDYRVIKNTYYSNNYYLHLEVLLKLR